MSTADGSATSPASASEGDGAPALSHAVARGAFWMVLSTVLQRGVGFGAQIVLGWLLTERDFGVFALAISIYALTGALRDGGVRQLLVQRHTDYEQLIGPTFWMALAFNTFTGLVLAATAPLAASALNEPALLGLMLVLAAAQPAATPAAIHWVRLSIDLRFRETARIATVSSLVRYFGTIALALAGFGPMSFVLPLPVLGLVEWAMGYAYTRERPWRSRPALQTWPRMLAQVKWIFIGTFGNSAMFLGASLTIKPFVSTEVVGVYYFASQVIMQIAMLLSANITQVFVPAFAKIVDERSRLSAAATRGLRQLMLIATPICLGLAATFGPLEVLIWRGKWNAAAEAVRVIAILYPAVIASAVTFSLQQSAGHFRASGLTQLAMGMATLGGSMAGAMLGSTPVAIAALASLVTGAVSIGIMGATMKRIGVPWNVLLAALLPAWLISCVAAGASFWFDELLAGSGAPAILRVLASGVVFVSVFAATTRLLVPSHIREAVAVMPRRIRGSMSRLLRMETPDPS